MACEYISPNYEHTSTRTFHQIKNARPVFCSSGSAGRPDGPHLPWSDRLRLLLCHLQLLRPRPGHGRVGGGPLGLDEPAPEGLRGLVVPILDISCSPNCMPDLFVSWAGLLFCLLFYSLFCFCFSVSLLLIVQWYTDVFIGFIHVKCSICELILYTILINEV